MKKIISISLAFILLASNIGLALTTHFCGGHAVENNLVIGISDLRCAMQEMEEDAGLPHSENGTFFSPQPCCDNDYKIFQLEEDVETPHLFSTSNLSPFVVQDVLNNAIQSQTFTLDYTSYSPPRLTHEVVISYQVFRI
ncbi:MAG: hypothetical protein HC811_11735 [Flammeovirgaceae bacterium]|nr:hypothetical protein [Flammeovirgaceae bacterium]